MSANAATTNAAAYKVLSRPDQWDDWIDQARLYMEPLELWHYMDTESALGFDERHPKEPTVSTLPTYDEALGARSATNPKSQKKVLFRLELRKTYGATYDAFVKKKEKATKYLTTYIDTRWQHILSGCITLL